MTGRRTKIATTSSNASESDRIHLMAPPRHRMNRVQPSTSTSVTATNVVARVIDTAMAETAGYADQAIDAAAMRRNAMVDFGTRRHRHVGRSAMRIATAATMTSRAIAPKPHQPSRLRQN